MSISRKPRKADGEVFVLATPEQIEDWVESQRRPLETQNSVVKRVAQLLGCTDRMVWKYLKDGISLGGPSAALLLTMQSDMETP